MPIVGLAEEASIPLQVGDIDTHQLWGRFNSRRHHLFNQYSNTVYDPESGLSLEELETEITSVPPSSLLGKAIGWYSLIETSKLNGVEPYLYLRCILSRLPDSENPEDFRPLLPWKLDKAMLLDFDGGNLF